MSESAGQALPVVVIGAGPIGLAAAANLINRGLEPLVVEAGPTAGTGVRQWGHIRLFSPWSQLIDPEAEKLLAPTGWTAPDPDGYPTGAEWVSHYLQPLADVLGDHVRYGARVTGVARQGRDLVVDAGRESEPFTVHVATGAGVDRIAARAVIDVSGTWDSPNPLGADGLPAARESLHARRITYRVPDLADPTIRARYAGKHVAVAGTGASAKTVLVALAQLAEDDPETTVTWLVRRPSTSNAFGGGENDQLAARGALGERAHAAVESSRVRTLTGFRTQGVAEGPDGKLRLESFDGQTVEGVNEIVAVTGFRPDLSMLTEVRLDLDPILQAPRQLAPLIDPNVHSCGTVYPHGARELAQPEPGFYMAGMKSYGRATSFLAMTGFEQVRSIAAEIDGDHDAAAHVELTLPETGVCGGSGVESIGRRMREPKPFEIYELGVLLHGTKADLAVGDLLVPGHASNFEEGRTANNVYVTATLDAATWGAELAVGDGRGRIYIVEPLGTVEDDPNVTDKKFPGNPTRSYRTRRPVKIVGELQNWTGHSPEQLKTMREGLEDLKRQGRAVIFD